MAEDGDESIWRARLRWRMRGAWQAPTFVASTFVGAVLLNRLPISGDDGLDPVGGFLLCGFFNLAVVAFLAPVVARVVQGRRPSPVPLAIFQDRVGTSLMGALGILLLAIGIGHHGAVRDARSDYARQLSAVRAYVAHQGPPEFLAGIGRESTWKQKDDFYRTCTPGPDPQRSLCLYVDTVGTAVVRRDPDQQSNSRIAGADNPGHRGG